MLPGMGSEVQRQPQRRQEEGGRELVVESDADASHELAAQALKEAIKAVEQQRQPAERHERRHALAGQDLVVDQHHEERAGQHQHVAEAADAADAQKGGLQPADRLTKLEVSAFGFFARLGMRAHGSHPLDVGAAKRLSLCMIGPNACGRCELAHRGGSLLEAKRPRCASVNNQGLKFSAATARPSSDGSARSLSANEPSQIAGDWANPSPHRAFAKRPSNDGL